MNKAELLLCVFIAGSFLLCARAQTVRYVSMDGTNDIAGGYTNWEGAATTIQAAVDASGINGDIIMVSTGIYTVASGAQVVNVNKYVILQGVYGRDSTIIDGQNARRGITIGVGAAGDPIMISGFTIRNGLTGVATNGAGIYVSNVRDIMFADCIISNNIAGGRGGGVYKTTTGSMLTMSNCVITHNQSLTTEASNGGGGVNVDNSKLRLLNCEIRMNTASSQSGGSIYFYAAADSSALLELYRCNVVSNYAALQGGGLALYARSGNYHMIIDSTIAGNTSGSGAGGGIYIHRSDAVAYITNCVIANNRCLSSVGGGVRFHGNGRITGCLIVSNYAFASGGGLYLGTQPNVCENLTIVSNESDYGGGLYVSSGSSATLMNSIIYRNIGRVNYSNFYIAGAGVAFTNSCTAPLTGVVGAGNTDADPLFVSVEGGNYKLQINSPCVNAGLNQAWMAGARDLEGFSRIDRFSGKVDMGAYEMIPRGVLFMGR